MTNEQVKVYVWTDFVCPYCLIGESTIHAAVEAEGAALVWLPFELRPHPTPTLRPEDDYLQTTWKKSVYPMAKRLGVDIRLPTISPQPYTRTAFIGMQWAADQGTANSYVEAVMRTFFQEDRDIGDIAVLKQIVDGLGLDADAFEAALVQPEYARRHDAALALARNVGVQAVPSVLIGDRLASGMQDVENLRAMIRAATSNLL
ncbi:DsbA family oxidoreductase [Sulfitobacter sp. HNIBRBA3233]|uniref:DsbA family oxidoreductase n=1 Tax=Sulfitobacter marinivivus TaxID=3158558 RepID=UPI0032DE9BB7